MSKQKIDDMFGDLFGDSFKSAGAAEGARLVRENQELKKKLAAANESVETLRTSKKFYQDNFNKAKAAYLKEVGLRKAREAQDAAEAAALVELALRYVTEKAAHDARDDPGFVFWTFAEWRAR